MKTTEQELNKSIKICDSLLAQLLKEFKADIADEQKLTQLFSNNKIDAVMHLAAEIQANESIYNPEKYFYSNVVSGMIFLNTMLQYKVKKLVFSSTAAVYGNPIYVPVKETHPTSPINPYGESSWHLRGFFIGTALPTSLFLSRFDILTPPGQAKDSAPIIRTSLSSSLTF